ncbi:hypothetical protein O181_081534 [Austropuccinia psidii MF-1]|uniref:Uncharacterized protein n=1 Tax=Austropuccinia psidii MF-1 TaxID=1389203 RepID=A0A9Q3FN09_9BASI|nr:hypothetical protein [Austropuccinia psidii MF-1]
MEASKGEGSVASTSKPKVSQPPQEGKKNQKNEFQETILPKLKHSKNPKRWHGQCLQHGQILDGIQGQKGTKNGTTSFPK